MTTEVELHQTISTTLTILNDLNESLKNGKQNENDNFKYDNLFIKKYNDKLMDIVRLTKRKNGIRDLGVLNAFMMDIRKKRDEILDPSKNMGLFIQKQRPHLHKIYELQEAAFWFPHEVNQGMMNDKKDLVDLRDEKSIWRMLKMTTAFLLFGDKILMEGIASFSDDIHDVVAKHFWSLQTCVEAIHNVTYETGAQYYFTADEIMEMEEMVNNSKSLIKMKQWCKKWLDGCSGENIATRIFANAITEGLFFQSSFVFIFWLKSKNKLNGFAFANELISQDENFHLLFAVELLEHDFKESMPSEEEAHKIIDEAVILLYNFFVEAMGDGDLSGLTKDMMLKHIGYSANVILDMCGYSILYKKSKKCPFPFMVKQALKGKTNFFEKKVGEYTNGANVAKSNKDTAMTIPYGDDF